jgi:hypothetical protein
MFYFNLECASLGYARSTENDVILCLENVAVQHHLVTLTVAFQVLQVSPSDPSACALLNLL